MPCLLSRSQNQSRYQGLAHSLDGSGVGIGPSSSLATGAPDALSAGSWAAGASLAALGVSLKGLRVHASSLFRSPKKDDANAYEFFGDLR